MIVLAVLGQSRTLLFAQGTQSEPLEIGGITVSGSLRTRLESWDWFGGEPNGTYTYPGSLFRIGFGQTRKTSNWQVELALPFLFGLPEQPVGAGPEGLGANYFIANHRSTSAAMLFVKQAYARFARLGGVEGQSLKVGRMEFFDGTEVSPKDATLAALKRDRVASRLLANFGFTHVARSLDGGQYAFDKPRFNVTAVIARPTRGVFQVDGWGDLNVNVFYAAVTRQRGDESHAGEWRLFALAYHDYRNGVVKVDNRPLASRQADKAHLRIVSFGGHYLRAIQTHTGPIDLLAWGAAQTGSWGDLSHRAGAFAAEVGWQPKIVFAPWLRGGFDYGSGDGNPTDSTHGTFFQVLPTPRLYARFPFFNMMNTADAFGELMVRPSRTVSIRADLHSLRLADAEDLWYQGGGAFQPATFGFVGQPSNGHQNLATLADASADVIITPRLTVGVYYGHAGGGPVPATIYPTHADSRLGYVELLLRF